MNTPTETVWWKNTIVAPAKDWVSRKVMILAAGDFDDRYQWIADYATDHLPADVGEMWATDNPDQADDITYELFHELVSIMLVEFVRAATERSAEYVELANMLNRARSQSGLDNFNQPFSIPVTADQ